MLSNLIRTNRGIRVNFVEECVKSAPHLCNAGGNPTESQHLGKVNSQKLHKTLWVDVDLYLIFGGRPDLPTPCPHIFGQIYLGFRLHKQALSI